MADMAKYIVVDALGDETWVPILFSALLTHRDVARPYRGRVRSAGFVFFRVEAYCTHTRCDTSVQAETYGRSESLNLDRHHEDDELIQRHIVEGLR